VENGQLDELQASLASLELLFKKVPEYLQKAALLQRDMAFLAQKADELKGRAEALRIYKLKEMEKEAQLQAKPAAALSTEPAGKK